MNTLELIAVALGLANIALLMRRSIWNYPFGMAMVALYFVIFREARLYGEAALQVFFLIVQGWGWWLWAHAGPVGQPVEVRFMTAPARAGALALVGAAALAVGWAMARFTDAALPFADATIAGASVVAQVLLAMRRVENWALWVAVDALAIAVYCDRGLYLTAGLYAVFLVMAAAGLVSWTKAARGGAAMTP